MSKLKFKGDVYSYSELLQLNIKKINHYLEGEVFDTIDGELCDISDLRTKFSCKYLTEFMSNSQIDRQYTLAEKKMLKNKYLNKSISKSEMFLHLKNIKQDKITPSYNYDKGYLIVNLNKIPFNVTDSEYGKFHKMLIFLSNNHKNKIAQGNSDPIKKENLSKFLGYKKVDYLNKYLGKLKKQSLIDEQTFGGVRYLIINPAYARKNMEIDNTVYKMFKKDLDECLTEEQIYYLNMSDDNIEIDSMIPILD